MQYFLDANAHVPLKLTFDEIKEAEDKLSTFGNPLSPSFIGQKTKKFVEQTREEIALLLGIEDAFSISFTSSCSEANYWASLIISNNFLSKVGNEDLPNINISPYEHRSINDCLSILPFNKNFIKLDNSGAIDNISNADYSIFIGAQNETGTIADFNLIRQNTNKLFMSDLAQVIGKTPINLNDSGIDIATFGAHKFGGPTGIGFLYLKDPENWCPLNNIKSYYHDTPGSLNVRGVYLAYLALKKSINNIKENMEKAKSFQIEVENNLSNIGFEVIGGNNRISTTTLVKVPDNKGLDLLLELSDNNVYVGLGSACGSSEEQPLLSAIALGYKDAVNTQFIRISQTGQYDYNDAKVVSDIIYKSFKSLE